jgi:hypothetical protein
LRPISLTSTLSKIAENLIIEYELKSKLLTQCNLALSQDQTRLLRLFQ